MLIKSLLRHNIRNLKHFEKRCQKYDHALKIIEEPKYPPIIDSTVIAQLQNERQKFYDSIKNLSTVQQKLYAIVSNHDYFSKVFFLNACASTYLGVPFQYYVTRTHFMEGLPEMFQNFNVDEAYDEVKDSLCHIVEESILSTWMKNGSINWADLPAESSRGNCIIDSVLSQCLKIFASRYPHLLEISVDQKPHVTTYWYHGGFKIEKTYMEPQDVLEFRRRISQKRIIKTKAQLADENLCFQFHDFPYYAVKINHPLAAIVPMDDALCSTAEVIDYNYRPTNFGIPSRSKYYINCLPGTWPGNTVEFPFLQVYTLDKMAKLLSRLQHHNIQNIENGMAVMTSFAWMSGLATYLGFSPYHDLTYPLVGQTILSNGKEWGFYVYQLNTMSFHEDVDMKDRRNLCWFSGKMKLFETIEDGKIKGFNDEVLKTLIKFILHKPEVTDTINLKPYLREDERGMDEIKQEKFLLHRLYKNKRHPRAHTFEIPLWVHIYKRHKLAPPSPMIKLK